MSAVFRPAALLFLLVTAALIALILWQNGGHFTYTIDDPYIHLAIAENLPTTFGPWQEENVGAASSILYPWLLAPFARSEMLGTYAPLVINILAGLLIIWSLVQAEQTLNLAPYSSRALRGLVVIGVAGGLNLFGLIFLGMEHTLHVACVLLMLLGWWRWLKEEPLPIWFWVAVALAPLLRYEALLFSGLTLLTCLVTGPRRPALLTSMALLAALTAQFSYFHFLGLPVLPNSLTLKSPLVATLAGDYDVVVVVFAVLLDLSVKLRELDGLLVFALTGLLMTTSVIYAFRASWRKSWLALILAALGAGHLLGGQFGWLGRYSAYVIAVQMLGLMQALSIEHSRYSRLRLMALLVLISNLTLGYMHSANIPRAALQVWQQPAQLQSFILNYWKRPVAAVDIGYISWRNDYAVADLFGLASPAIRKHITQEGKPTAELTLAILKRYGAALIICYDYAHTVAAPAGSIKVGELQLEHPRIIVQPSVSFLLTEPTLWPELYRDLEAWRLTLPPGVTLLTAPPPAQTR